MHRSRLFIYHLRRLIDSESNRGTGGDLLISEPLYPFRPWVPHKGFNREQPAEAWSSPQTSIKCRGWECVDSYLHCLIRLQTWCLTTYRHGLTLLSFSVSRRPPTNQFWSALFYSNCRRRWHFQIDLPVPTLELYTHPSYVLRFTICIVILRVMTSCDLVGWFNRYERMYCHKLSWRWRQLDRLWRW